MLRYAARLLLFKSFENRLGRSNYLKGSNAIARYMRFGKLSAGISMITPQEHMRPTRRPLQIVLELLVSTDFELILTVTAIALKEEQESRHVFKRRALHHRPGDAHRQNPESADQKLPKPGAAPSLSVAVDQDPDNFIQVTEG